MEMNRSSGSSSKAGISDYLPHLFAPSVFGSVVAPPISHDRNPIRFESFA